MLKELNDAYLNITEMITEIYSEIMINFNYMNLIIIGIVLFLGGSVTILNIYKEEFLKDIIIGTVILLSTILIFILLIIFIFNFYRKYFIKYVKPIYKFKKLHNSLSLEIYKINMLLNFFNGDEIKVRFALQNHDDLINKIRNEYLEQLFNIKKLVDNFIEDSKNKRFVFEYDNSRLFSLLLEYNNSVDKIGQLVKNV